MRQPSTVLRHQPGDSIQTESLDALDQQAWREYELSLSDQVTTEHASQHRGEARLLAQRMLKTTPDCVPALNLIGRIALDEGFYETAEQHLSRALDQAPEDAGCWYSMGHVALAKRQFDKAVQCFGRSLDLAPGETRAATSLVYTFARQGNIVQAFNGYRQLMRVHPEDPHVRAKLFEVAQHIQADHYQKELEQDVIAWLSLENVDHDGLSLLVASLLKHKYRLDDEDAVIDLQDLAKDTLLNLALNKLYFTQSYLESFLTLVRKQVLLHSLSSQFSDRALIKLAGAFTLQACHNEHVYAIDEHESDLVDSLRDMLETVLKQPAVQPGDCLNALLLYGMYEPLTELRGARKLANIALNHWPNWARPIVRNALLSGLMEDDLVRTIEPITPISDPVSIEVQAQYEENPYPRWLHLGYNSPTNYGRALESELEGYRAPQFFNMGTVQVLIAGAGTGRHALRVAKYFRNVEVTAIDLSARSLAYAQKMAHRYRIRNVRFLQGDLLDIDRLEQQFHVIECSGVLHHMADPEAGLAKLKGQLLPKGVMKIALYSEAARKVVVDARHWIERLGYQPNREDIRRFRNLLMNERLEGDFSALFDSRDFYSTSGCRDLLFHVQEHRFTIPQLKSLLDRHELEFLGFVTSEAIQQRFKQLTPDTPSLRDLDAWHQFEQQEPTTFSGMYQFYTQTL
ncbi:class I SAM-dependent methyltransferase [Saccharospirillum salsuginis]|uniref:Methyltransferase domain-containing protein n=1 Tax=Saccharospirillum salsuginis TaxID=418750 RepID=A0A918K7Z7_9GAMM|nr:class I SAM-dependent methyltransferase [Saccharospirillum salsuginis]GGX50632.1 hypothetical protein GCM10007392_17250 [Saccharospirillum salsuginis]